MGFAELLESLPSSELERLLSTRGVQVDPNKVLSRGEQAARALAILPVRMLHGLPPSSREALDRLLPAPGRIPRVELGPAARPLIELGLAYELGEVVLCPPALRVQLPVTRGEDPRGARALLSAANEETLRALLHGGLRGRAGSPRPLLLGELLERLEDRAALTRDIESLPLAERTALSAIEARGSEVSSSELLSLAREPARWEARGSIPKKGPAHALLAHGYLFPAGHDRFVLASEVAAVAGRERRALLDRRRRTLLAKLESTEDETARAALASDPGPLAVALVLELTASGDLPREGRGLRRTDLARVARALDVPPERAEVLVTLARALPLDTLVIDEVGGAMIERWLRTAVHDESRGPSASGTVLLPSAITLVREIALDALRMLPRGRFVAIDDVVRAARADPRAEGVEAGMRAQGGPGLEDVLRRIVLVSLPALGIVDAAADGTLRLASRGASMLASEPPRASRERPFAAATWTDRRARFPGSARVGLALSLAKIARAAIDDGALVLVLDPERARPLSVETATLARSLERAEAPAPLIATVLAALPSAVAVAHASPPARWIPIEDAALVARLLEDPKIAREVVAGGPGGGLLLHAHGSFPRLARLFAKHGVDLRDGA